MTITDVEAALEKTANAKKLKLLAEIARKQGLTSIKLTQPTAQAMRQAVGGKSEEIMKKLEKLPAGKKKMALQFAAGAVPGGVSELLEEEPLSDKPALRRALESALVWGGSAALAGKVLKV